MQSSLRKWQFCSKAHFTLIEYRSVYKIEVHFVGPFMQKNYSNQTTRGHMIREKVVIYWKMWQIVVVEMQQVLSPDKLSLAQKIINQHSLFSCFKPKNAVTQYVFGIGIFSDEIDAS